MFPCLFFHQDDPQAKLAGARSIAAYMQRCDAVLTPYVERFYQDGEEGIHEGLLGSELSPGGKRASRAKKVRCDDDPNLNFSYYYQPSSWHAMSDESSLRPAASFFNIRKKM